MSDSERHERQLEHIRSDEVPRGPQLRVSVSQPMKDHVEATAARLGYHNTAEFVREAILLRVALAELVEHSNDIEAVESMLRRLLGREAP